MPAVDVDVGLLARSRSGTEEPAAALGGPGEALALEGDVTDHDSVRRALERLRDRAGAVEALVHTASAPGGESLEDTTAAKLESTWRGRAGGPLTCLRACEDDLRAAGGTVLVRGTNYATDPRPGQLRFASAAAATRGLARALAGHEGLRSDGVSVTYVAIGAAVAPRESTRDRAFSADAVADSYWSLLTDRAAAPEITLEPRG